MVEQVLLKITVAGSSHWQTVIADDYTAMSVALHEVVGEDVAELATLHSTHLHRHVRVACEVNAVHTVSQFLHCRAVVSEVGGDVELEVACLHRRTIEHELNTGIVDLASVHPLLCPRRRSVYEHSLVLRSIIIIGEVEAETVVEELHIYTHLIRGLNLWLQVGVELNCVVDRLAVAHLELILAHVVKVVRSGVLTYLRSRHAQLCERNPRRQLMVDRSHEVGEYPAERCRRIEERVVLLRQRRRPVVACCDVEREPLVVSQLSRSESRVHSAAVSVVESRCELVAGVEYPVVLLEHVLHRS